MSEPNTRPRSALFELTRMRIVEFFRDPGALFWVFGFPILLAFVLGLAFRNRPPEPIHVVVVGDPRRAEVLKREPGFQVEEAGLDDARWRLRRAQVDLLVEAGSDDGLVYRYDETRPEARIARLAYISEFVEQAKASGVVQRAIDRAGQPGYRVASPVKLAAQTSVPDVMALTPSEMKWMPQGGLVLPGMEQTNLVGDPAKPGPYTIRLKFPAGYKVAPHTHPDSREVTILSGTWYTGYGEKFDPAALKELPAGSFYTEPANVAHFVEVREPVLIQVSGTGPSGRKFVNPADNPK